MAIHNEAFDLVLMDVEMEINEGFKAVQKIRAIPDKGKLPIIGLTISSKPGSHYLLLEKGFDAFCMKPVNEDEVIRTISKWSGCTSIGNKSDLHSVEMNKNTGTRQKFGSSNEIRLSNDSKNYQ